MSSLEKLWARKVWEGMAKLDRYISRERWLAMIDADDAAMQRLAAPWPGSVPSCVYDSAHVASLFDLPRDGLVSCGVPPQARAGFITFFDPGWSIALLRQIVFAQETAKYWYHAESFVRMQGDACYRQLRMESPSEAFDKAFPDQQRCLLEDEQVPSARTIVMGMVIHFLTTGKWLFRKEYVRCCDSRSDSREQIDVGFTDPDGSFLSGGIRISYSYDDKPDPVIGLAVEKKPWTLRYELLAL